MYIYYTYIWRPPYTNLSAYRGVPRFEENHVNVQNVQKIRLLFGYCRRNVMYNRRDGRVHIIIASR